MRTDEYLRLQMACVAMARQSQLADVQARWAKLAADAAFVADDAALGTENNLPDRPPGDTCATGSARRPPRGLAQPPRLSAGCPTLLDWPIIASGPTAPAHACCWRPLGQFDFMPKPVAQWESRGSAVELRAHARVSCESGPGL